jgi:hypothetical protein
LKYCFFLLPIIYTVSTQLTFWVPELDRNTFLTPKILGFKFKFSNLKPKIFGAKNDTVVVSVGLFLFINKKVALLYTGCSWFVYIYVTESWPSRMFKKQKLWFFYHFVCFFCSLFFVFQGVRAYRTRSYRTLRVNRTCFFCKTCATKIAHFYFWILFGRTFL